MKKKHPTKTRARQNLERALRKHSKLTTPTPEEVFLGWAGDHRLDCAAQVEVLLAAITTLTLHEPHIFGEFLDMYTAAHLRQRL